MEELKNAVTENYWNSRDQLDKLKRELSRLKDEIHMAEGEVKLNHNDFQYIWEEENPTYDRLSYMAGRHGVDESTITGDFDD